MFACLRRFAHFFGEIIPFYEAKETIGSSLGEIITMTSYQFSLSPFRNDSSQLDWI